MPQSNASTQRLRVRLAYSLLALVSLGYLGITLTTPIDQRTQSFALTSLQLHALQLTVALPVVAVWFVALWGSLRFKRYAQAIYESPDGQALDIVATGLLALVGSLAVTTTFQAVHARMVVWGYVAIWTIFGNYLGVALSLVAFSIILLGAFRLAKTVHFRGAWHTRWLVLGLLAVMGGVYAWSLAHNPYRLSTSDPLRFSSYYLPDWSILGTIVLPYILVWYCGLMAVAYLWAYQVYSSGIIYRKALSLLSFGLLAIIMASVLIQLVTAVSPLLSNLGLASILLLLYALIAIYAVGHILVAVGARRLRRIEEVE